MTLNSTLGKNILSFPSPDNAIDLRKIHKSYGCNHVLKGINLQVKKGDFFGLLGINGAGKSTLINIIAGLTHSDKGESLIFGFDTIKDFRQARQQIGVVPQELINEPFIPLRKLLLLQSGYFGIQSNEEWINEVLNQVGLTEKANDPMSSLSGGMKKRMLIAMAIAHKPQIIILDEPTAGVDINKRQQIWQFINSLHQKGHTIILTTHYLEEAENLCNRIAIIDKGEIITNQSKSDMLNSHNGQRLEQIFLRYVNNEI